MMTDIFSSFDMNNFNLFSMTSNIWIFAILPLIIFQNTLWVMPSRSIAIILMLKMFMASQIMRNTGKNISGFMMMMVSMFLLLIFVNLMGLFPYVFSLSSQLSFALCYGLPLWLSLIISSIFYSFHGTVSHFLPSGAPSVLNPFLILVETVSINVRPITLSIRLVANMTAGHIILGLIASYLSVGFFTYSLPILLMMIFIQIFYFMFEMAICLIQAYIFSLLVGLYSDDHPMFLI
uniref:ATP synthase subunit a n=1 Tax=Cyanoplax caverna TaxID=1503210 RepID=A0A0E3DEF0_9MOLL|nr:ATP synthase F0 subunit 6 [Cyanoplax caverna]AIA77055.1 ATP synthase F0 subunit 6 [Cyanoplax caverna]